jgi:hypothetical protein
MKGPIDLREKAAASEDGEYVFGAQDTGSHACYMIYGILRPGEKKRVLKPGRGHEEMIVSVNAELHLRGDCSGKLPAGSALHLVGEESAFLENPSSEEALYIIAGGHSEGGHHH